MTQKLDFHVMKNVGLRKKEANSSILHDTVNFLASLSAVSSSSFDDIPAGAGE